MLICLSVLEKMYFPIGRWFGNEIDTEGHTKNASKIGAEAEVKIASKNEVKIGGKSMANAAIN